jgi:hypothetical protein
MGMFGNLMGAFGGNRNNTATTANATTAPNNDKPKRRNIED